MGARADEEQHADTAFRPRAARAVASALETILGRALAELLAHTRNEARSSGKGTLSCNQPVCNTILL